MSFALPSLLRSLAAAGAAMTIAIAPVHAEAPPRVRGIVAAVDDTSVTVKQQDGSAIRLLTGPYTAYATVVPASLDEIKPGTFIGTAIKGLQDAWIAVEIVIVPDGMQAGRLGYAGWDSLPDTSGVQTSGVVATEMTNGTVSGLATGTHGLTNTAMTNGTVVSSANATAGRTLSLTLVGGREARIVVLPAAPVTRFEVASQAVVTVGSTVFIKTNSGNQAGLLAVGKGVTPPM